MKISGYFIKFSMILLILDYTCLYSHCSLVENVNEAIIAIFHDEIKNEESKTNEIEAFVKLFIENQRGDDTAEIEIKSVKAACSEANNVSICGRYLSEQVSILALQYILHIRDKKINMKSFFTCAHSNQIDMTT